MKLNAYLHGLLKYKFLRDLRAYLYMSSWLGAYAQRQLYTQTSFALLCIGNIILFFYVRRNIFM